MSTPCQCFCHPHSQWVLDRARNQAQMAAHPACPCPCCARALASAASKEHPAGADSEPPVSDHDLIQADLREIMDALGLSTHARPYSPHEVVQREVLPAIKTLRDLVRRQAAALSSPSLEERR